MMAELVQAAVLVLISPLIAGIVSKFKAWMQNRPGADIFQPYRDLAKLFRKDSAVSRSCTGVFRLVPAVCMASMLILAAMTPFFYTGILAPYGGLVTVVYMFTMYRFAMVLGGLEGGSTFGGMGSSREMMMSVLIEPALLLSIATLAVLSGAGTDMGAISAAISGMGAAALTAPLILAACSFMITLLAENARIPFDNPTTHLELTMVHEAMLLEYSGRDLAMMELSSMMRLTLFMAMIGSLFFPWGIATGTEPMSLLVSFIIAMAEIVLVAFVLALIESVLCKSRLFKTPNLLTVSFALSLIAMVSIYILRGDRMDNFISGNLVDLCAVMMLLTSVMAVATTRMKPLITLFSVQSFFLAAEAFIVAWTSGNSHIYIMCGLTIVLKVIVMPKMLVYIMSKIHVDKEVELSIGIPGSLLACGFMIFLSYYITDPLISTMETVERSCLALSLSIILIGLLIMCTRRKAITETIGLLMMENGLFLGAIALSHGMPLIVEIAAFFDVMVAVIIIGIFANRINKSFNSVDTSFLRRLRE